MPVNNAYPILTLERANNWSFAPVLDEITINVLAVDPDDDSELIFEAESGSKSLLSYRVFDIECCPFVSIPSLTHPDRGDRLDLMAFLRSGKPLRVKECTTLPYKDPCPARTMLINRQVVYSGEHSRTLNKENGTEDFSFKLSTRLPET